jgi:CheY-like chemotaxis protein
MNGYEATEIIRNLESTEKQNIPIIALTAHTQNSERIKCKEYGMNDFLSKPYTIEDLANVIEAYAKK